MDDRWRGRHAVVFGGAGFLGSHLTTALVGRGCRVTVVDNFATGEPANLGQLTGTTTLAVVSHDVSRSIPDIDRPDHVFHLASPASPEDYVRIPIETLMTGANGTRHGLELAKSAGASFLLASTSEVYGQPTVHPQPETYFGNVNSVGPRASYDEAKRFAEALTVAYRDQHGVRIRIARIFNTYGPRMRLGDGRVVPAFFEAAIRDEPLPIHGDGTQTRSLCYQSDLVEGLMRLMADGPQEPVNLGRPEQVTMLTLAEMVQDVVGTSPGVVHVPGRPEDPARRQPDITRAIQELGWVPRTTLHTGLRASVDWFRDAVRESPTSGVAAAG